MSVQRILNAALILLTRNRRINAYVRNKTVLFMWLAVHAKGVPYLPQAITYGQFTAASRLASRCTSLVVINLGSPEEFLYGFSIHKNKHREGIKIKIQLYLEIIRNSKMLFISQGERGVSKPVS